MRERVVTFGPGGILVGIMTEPDEPPPRGSVVVMSNVGLNHRVGPQRVWVELARRLAKRGIPSLRFDIAGLGDSAPRTELLSDIDRSVLDLEEAINWLAGKGFERFELVSLCSGVDNAHRVAVRDPRVKTAVFLDGYTYETPRAFIRKKILRWVDLPRWKRLLRRRFPEAFGLELDKHAVGWADEIFNREYPSQSQFERELATMVGRGTSLLYVFSGELMYRYKEQFWDALKRKDWGGRISVEYYPKADHTCTFRPERDVMLSRVENWIVAGQR
jgi:hypothetical protein